MKSDRPELRAQNALRAAKIAVEGLNVSVRQIAQAVEIINSRGGDIVVTGIGKTGFIGQKFAATLTSLGQRAFYIHPTEALHGDLGALSKGDVLISLSFSGESKEVVNITKYSKKNFNVPVISLSKNAHSSLGKISDCVVVVPVTEEGSPNSVAPMASTTATLVLCDMIAAAVTSDRFSNDHFATLHPGGALGLRLKRVKEFMTKGVEVPKVKTTSSFLRAVEEINKKKLGISAVVDNQGRIVGAVSDGDIRRFVLRNKQKINLAGVTDVMTCVPRCVDENSTLQDSLTLMENFKITSVFVINRSKKLVGIIHVHRIIEQTL